jgi:sulfotransferase
VVENKKFFFMAGLQRSGGTVLSSILNQNPNLHSSPSSPLLPMLLKFEKTYDFHHSVNFDRNNAINFVLKNISKNFYSDHDKKYIIDKNHEWSLPIAVEAINKYITEDIKIICPVRDIVEVLASFNTIIEKNNIKNKNIFIDEGVSVHTYPDIPMADRRADFMMMPDKDIASSLYGMGFAKRPEFRHMFHFIEYNDLIANPTKVLNNLYDYLEIEKFDHIFDGLESNIPRENSIGIYDLHTIHPKLEKKSVDPRSIFSEATIRRYSGLEFWRDLK